MMKMWYIPNRIITSEEKGNFAIFRRENMQSELNTAQKDKFHYRNLFCKLNKRCNYYYNI